MIRAQGSSPLIAGLVLLIAVPAFGQVLPGTGRKVDGFGDDFEDPNWSYVLNGSKSSHEDDGNTRGPLGFSRNGRWVESALRGHPDYVMRVDTPAGGLPGSKGALRLQSVNTGIPGRPSYKMMQDDFLARNHEVLPSQNPSYITRVYLPPFEQWEDRTGSTFGFRIGCRTTKSQIQEKRGLFGIDLIPGDEQDAYWPGMFIQFLSSHDRSREKDAAVLVCRAGTTGNEFQGPTMRPGWWTLGLSVSADGAVHYYAAPGVGRLTPNDRIGSAFPYGYRAERVTTMFYNVCSPDNGRTWSTPWIVDDPEMYLGGVGGSLAGVPGAGQGWAASPEANSSANEIPERSSRKKGGFLGGLFR